MRSLLAKIAIRTGVGLYLGEHDVAVSKVAATPLGPVELASASAPYTPEDLASVLERLLTPLLGRKRRVPVAVGLPSSRIFFGTRLIRTGGESSPEAVLQKALCSSNISVDDLTVDLLHGTVNKSPVTNVAACRKKYMAGVVATLTQIGVRPFRTEPSPCALVRLAAQQHHFPRRSKTVLCVFLNATQGLAVLVAGGMPLGWRKFILPAGGEGSAILCAARTLRTQHTYYGIESSLDFAIIYGRPDLSARLQEEEFPTDMGTRVMWHEGPAFDDQAMAMGLALGCLSQNALAFDLSRTLKPRPSIGEIFPWGELAFGLLLLACMGGILGAHSNMLDDSYAAVRAESSRHRCLRSADQKKLEKEKKSLTEKVEAVQKFLDTRILWSTYTHDLSARLPVGTVLSAFDGAYELEGAGKKAGAGKKSFVLRAVSPIQQDGSMPREIDSFLKSLHTHPLWLRDFGSVEITDIKRSQNRDKATATAAASFTIVCSSSAVKNAGGASPASPDGSKDKKAGK